MKIIINIEGGNNADYVHLASFIARHLDNSNFDIDLDDVHFWNSAFADKLSLHAIQEQCGIKMRIEQ
jgi:hypothetical protein